MFLFPIFLITLVNFCASTRSAPDCPHIEVIKNFNVSQVSQPIDVIKNSLIVILISSPDYGMNMLEMMEWTQVKLIVQQLITFKLIAITYEL